MTASKKDTQEEANKIVKRLADAGLDFTVMGTTITIRANDYDRGFFLVNGAEVRKAIRDIQFEKKRDYGL